MNNKETYSDHYCLICDELLTVVEYQCAPGYISHWTCSNCFRMYDQFPTEVDESGCFELLMIGFSGEASNEH